MTNLDDLRRRSYSGPTARAWGADMRPVGRDSVVVAVPGAPRFYTHQLSIASADAGPAAGALGIILGALLGWLLASLFQAGPGLFITAGAVLGWFLTAQCVNYVGRELISARLGLPRGTQLVLVAHPDQHMNADQQRLLILLDAAGDQFVREQVSDGAFMNAVARTIPALRPRTTPAAVDAARDDLERLLSDA
ncbi:hypothetical protein GCM10028787_32870 [Brachybacterium horti]